MPDKHRKAIRDPLDSVSRETTERLAAFESLVLRWSPRINLIASRTATDIRNRHTSDSAQLLDLAPVDARSWVDLGAGGGFPGIVVAILAAERRPALDVALVESDARKCAFLETAVRDLGLSTSILRRRAEAPPERAADVVSARALAPLAKLLPLALPWRAPGGLLLLPKGARVDDELTEARKCWHMEFDRIASATDPEASVLRIKECRRAG